MCVSDLPCSSGKPFKCRLHAPTLHLITQTWSQSREHGIAKYQNSDYPNLFSRFGPEKFLKVKEGKKTTTVNGSAAEKKNALTVC